MVKKHILVIEDDHAIRLGLVDVLEINGYETSQAKDSNSGLNLALNSSYDLMLLDLVLPGKCDGYEILKEMRLIKPTVPVIILTARGEVADRIKGLKNGADDYVIKPFNARELLARLEAVLRRSPERPTELNNITIPGGYVDLARSVVCFKDSSERELSEKEIQLLSYLGNNSGRVISRAEILSRVWGLNPDSVATRTIDMHVVRLREKLRNDPVQPDVIVTVRGKGYRLGQRQESK